MNFMITKNKLVITKNTQKDKLIDIKDVYKIYKQGDNELCVLSDINLTIYSGDFVIILGPSGSVTLSLAIYGVLLSIGICVLSGFIPAYRASKLKPVKALRYE